MLKFSEVGTHCAKKKSSCYKLEDKEDKSKSIQLIGKETDKIIANNKIELSFVC